jgi:hypothetical protein
LLIQHVQGGYCDKSCRNEFHDTPMRNDSRGEDDEESGAELGRAGRSAQPRDYAHVDGAALGGALAAPE